MLRVTEPLILGDFFELTVKRCLKNIMRNSTDNLSDHRPSKKKEALEMPICIYLLLNSSNPKQASLLSETFSAKFTVWVIYQSLAKLYGLLLILRIKIRTTLFFFKKKKKKEKST